MNKNLVVTSTSQHSWSIQISANLLLSFLFRFRLWCQRVIGHKMFDHVILLFIFLNCITIALERPDIQPNSMVTYIRPAVICLDPVLTVYSETKCFHQWGFKHYQDSHASWYSGILCPHCVFHYSCNGFVSSSLCNTLQFGSRIKAEATWDPLKWLLTSYSVCVCVYLCVCLYMYVHTCVCVCMSPHVWQERVFLSVSNYIFTVIFVGEMMMKVSKIIPFSMSTSLLINFHSYCILCSQKVFRPF